jgi:hypothetical protein
MESTKSRFVITFGVGWMIASFLLLWWEIAHDGDTTVASGMLFGGAVVGAFGVCLRFAPNPRVGRGIVGLGLLAVLVQLLISAVQAARQGVFEFHLSMPGILGACAVAALGGCMTRREG